MLHSWLFTRCNKEASFPRGAVIHPQTTSIPAPNKEAAHTTSSSLPTKRPGPVCSGGARGREGLEADTQHEAAATEPPLAGLPLSIPIAEPIRAAGQAKPGDVPVLPLPW